MADRNLVQELKRWATEEFNLPPESLPSDSYFKTCVYGLTFLLFFSFIRCIGLVLRYVLISSLCVGTGKSIWKYLIQHVFQHR